MESLSDHNTKWSPLLILAGVVTTLGASVPVGYSIGVVNAPAKMIQTFINETIYDRYGSVLTASELDILWSSFVSIFLIGGVTGSLSGGWVADKIGRKGAVWVCAVLSIIPAILFFACRASKSVEMLMVGRLVGGLAGGLTTSTVPMYLNELAPLSLKGSLAVFTSLGVTGGVVVGQVAGMEEFLGRESAWHYLLSFYVILVLGGCLCLPILPESPKYLYIVKNQREKAMKELSRLRGHGAALCSEIQELEGGNEKSPSQTNTGIINVLKDPTLRLPLMLVCFFQAGQQLSGINAVFYYSVATFEAAGMSNKEAQFGNLGAGGVNFAVACLTPVLMAKINRRPIFQVSCFGASIALVLMAVVVINIDTAEWLSYTSIACILVYVFFFQLGLGPIPYFIGSELCEVTTRPSAMALGSMANWGGNFVVGITFKSIESALGAYVFLIFAAFTFCLAIFARIYLPETRGYDPSVVAPLVAQGLKSRPLEQSRTLIS